MKKNFRYATMAYLIYLGAVLGMVVYAAVAVLPVEMGVLVYPLWGVMIAVALYEGYRFKMGEHGKIEQAATIMVIASAVLLSSYYLPDILRAADVPDATRIGMMIDAGVLAFSILALMIVNMRKACR
jgi:hypothetical protein